MGTLSESCSGLGVALICSRSSSLSSGMRKTVGAVVLGVPENVPAGTGGGFVARTVPLMSPARIVAAGTSRNPRRSGLSRHGGRRNGGCAVGPDRVLQLAALRRRRPPQRELRLSCISTLERPGTPLVLARSAEGAQVG